LVIAAPASGSGKTTVATGLMAAFARQRMRVAPFKVGPDYIDPGYHALATGLTGRNLDPVLVGESLVGPLFAHGSTGADLAIVEGVMGLFDGRGSTPFGSTAHVARLLDAPVVLVVDARGQGRSLAALLHGFRGYDPNARLAAVVLNQVGSARHEQVLREACAEIGLPVLGAVPRGADVALPSRHLGLVPAAEHGASARHAVAAMAELITQSVDLDEVRRLAATAGPVTWPAWDPAAHVGDVDATQPVVAVAGGSAFTFGYAEHTELLAAAGADVATVDPLHDDLLPDRTAALLLPGGFPEEHADALSDNPKLRQSVAAFARSGGIVQAECGGLLYLLDELAGRPMCGVLPGKAELGARLTLGYRDAVAATDSAAHRAGERRTGHEFHRTQVLAASEQPAWHWRDNDGRGVAEGFVRGNVHASYLHTHPAGRPETVARLVTAARGRT
jgi:cobyrinic acid a,c-diamide synthase